ncbi:MAG TPA: Rieske 2Fe-2S domain-containing protein [Verrucomicrobiae bacterium]|jgi:nitrite reductase (NADH) small subunit|nr:Rieske 2Fe-2S domain-containing protein [Verrucomicrobiae bacterium]
MTDFERVADALEVPVGTSKAFVVGRYEVAVFNVAGAFFGLENCCPHQGGPLADGWLEGAEITCPWHAWCFDVRTGRMTLGDFACVPRFAIKLEDGAIHVCTEPELDV